MLDTCTAHVHAHGHFRARRMSCFFDSPSGPGFRLDEALGFMTRWALTSIGGAVCLGMLAESQPRLRPLVQTLGILAMLMSWCWVFLGVGILRDTDPLPFQLPALFVIVASYLAVTSEEDRWPKWFYGGVASLVTLMALAQEPLRDLGLGCEMLLGAVALVPLIAALCVRAFLAKSGRASHG